MGGGEDTAKREKIAKWRCLQIGGATRSWRGKKKDFCSSLESWHGDTETDRQQQEPFKKA